MNAPHKILALIFIQAILITSSFLVTAYFELQHLTNGKLIDITGKTRLLASTVQLETYRALFHDSETHRHVEIAIEELEHNVVLLEQGGIVDGDSVPDLPQELHSELDEMIVVVDQYTAAVTEIINFKESLTYDNVEVAHTLSNEIVEMANNITQRLSADVDNASALNLSLLIFLGICNVIVLTLITVLVWRIIRTHVAKVVDEKRFEALGKFAAVMAHNIRNPLGSLHNSVELIKGYDLDTQFDREVERIDRSIRRISHQIEGILNFVNGVPLHIRPVILSNILRNAVDMLMLPKNIDLRMPDDQSITIECDDKKIEFVFYNLLLNAVHAIGIDQGHITVRIRDVDVGSGDKNGAVILEFENSGPSIPPDVLPHVFDPLFTTKKDGTGLGLAYCKNVVELHNGRITTSTQNGLVVFLIHIPKTQDISSTDGGGGVVRRV